MTITNGYCTLDDFNRRRNLTTVDAARDTNIEQMIEAASREIDVWCGRRFYAATETHYFAARHTDLLFIDDLISVTTLKSDEDGDGTFETTWSSTDYTLEPRNAAYAIPPAPYTMIRVTNDGDYNFPILAFQQEGVQIAGAWGYGAAVPDPIREACILRSIQLFNATYGVSPAGRGGGNATTGQAQSISVEVIQSLIAPFKRLV